MPVSDENASFHLASVATFECDALVDGFRRIIQLRTFHEMALIVPVQESTDGRYVCLLTTFCKASSDQAAA